MTNLCQKIALASAATVAVAATIISAESASAQNAIICESFDFRTTECLFNTRRSVFLERQLSRASCVEGIDWGYQRGFIWVRNGCRGLFTSGNVSGNWSPPGEEACCIEEEVHRPKPRRRVRRRPRTIHCP